MATAVTKMPARPLRERRRPFVLSAFPTFSQALSAFIKTIRLRRVDEAIYWLVYCDGFSSDEKEHRAQRFRIARRLLTAEDNMSVAVMEATGRRFRPMSKVETPLEILAAETVRICKVPNWWDPSTGGHDFVEAGYRGHLQCVTNSRERDPEVLKQTIREAIANGDKATAIGAVDAITGGWDQTAANFGLWQHPKAPLSCNLTAEFLLEIAHERQDFLAERMLDIHLRCRSALSDDCGFTWRSAWVMCGGVCHVNEAIDPVDLAEVEQLLAEARMKWTNPQPIPAWCCDGVHTSGSDRRFAGLWPSMHALCNAMSFYGRIEPELEWKPEFYGIEG